MPRRTIPLVPGSYYHVYNRGHNGANIFFETENYLYFINKFRTYIGRDHAQVIAYVLMPNHYHFLLEVISDQFSFAMKNFSISYVRAINERYKRTGALFQGAFQARIIEQNSYLLQLSKYIHLNPVHAKLEKKPETWPYSSYNEYIGYRKGTFPHPEIILEQFGSNQASAPEAYRCFVEEPHDEILPGHLLFD
jgi:REP element-mobilizing transposase RayT